MPPSSHAPRARRWLAALLFAAAWSGCAPDPERAAARRVGVVRGFSAPESVRYDPRQDVYFVSNIVGFGSVKDGNGYISRIGAADLRGETFVQGGRDGAVLHAPKGMALQGDTLWVADIDALRAFDRRTGAPLAVVDLRPHGAVLLNDVALAPDGAVYVTDSGIAMTSKGVLFPGGSKVFSVSGPGHAVSLVAEGRELAHPNGITWDSAAGRWMVVTFHPFNSEVYTLGEGGRSREALARGSGRFDGIEVLDDERFVYTSWSDSSLHLVSGERDERVVRDLWQPADPGVDTRRGRVAIPLVLQGRMEVWELPAR